MAGYGESYENVRFTYENGNTVRYMEAAPQEVPDYHEERLRRQEERRQAEIRRRHRKAAHRNRERALQMSGRYVAFLSACVMLVAGAAASFVYLQSEVLIRQENIAMLESEISDLRIDNDSTYKRIMTSVDLKKIKRQAKSLGMGYPSQSQIVYYSVDNPDYMTRYH